jgi:hypothetical protein
MVPVSSLREAKVVPHSGEAHVFCRFSLFKSGLTSFFGESGLFPSLLAGGGSLSGE